MKRIIISCLMLAAGTASVLAQGGATSPYSQFGLGILADQSQGASRGMNGVGIALRNSIQVNAQNPASYSSVDSLTMLIDAGVTGQLSHFKENDVRLNTSSASFDYAVASFRAFRNFGVALGVLPFSNIGYEFSTINHLDDENGSMTSTYSGSGGLHQVFLGFGWRVLKPLSVGVNASYLWGDYSKSVVTSGNSQLHAITKSYSAEIQSYKLDFGVQWMQSLSRQDMLTLGATVGLGHKLGADAVCTTSNTTNGTSTPETVTDAFELPMSYGVGAALNHRNQLLLAADARVQKWGGKSFPEIRNGKYVSSDQLLCDNMNLSVGVDWLPTLDPYNRHFLSHMHYRAGVGYATPYYKINGQDGPKELTVSLGFGMPLGRSTLNVSGQWARRSATNYILDNTFRVTIGFTFNERWFAKWKVD